MKSRKKKLYIPVNQKSNDVAGRECGTQETVLCIAMALCHYHCRRQTVECVRQWYVIEASRGAFTMVGLARTRGLHVSDRYAGVGNAAQAMICGGIYFRLVPVAVPEQGQPPALRHWPPCSRLTATSLERGDRCLSRSDTGAKPKSRGALQSAWRFIDRTSTSFEIRGKSSRLNTCALLSRPF